MLFRLNMNHFPATITLSAHNSCCGLQSEFCCVFAHAVAVLTHFAQRNPKALVSIHSFAGTLIRLVSVCPQPKHWSHAGACGALPQLAQISNIAVGFPSISS